MSGNVNGKPRSLVTVTHYAKVSRAVVLRRMASDQCFSSRVFWAMVLWSWCGPGSTEDGAVVRKDAKGYIVRDERGQPIPAQQKDIFRLLGLKQGQKTEISRALARLTETHQIWTDAGGMMYVDPDPPALEEADPVDSIVNWKVADKVIKCTDLPSDPEARAAAIRWLGEISTAWRNDLKELRTRYRKLLVLGISEHGLDIDKKRRREDNNNNTPPAPEPPTPERAVVVVAFDPSPLRATAKAQGDPRTERLSSEPLATGD